MRRLLLLASAVVFVDTAFYAAITPLLPHYVDTLDISKSAAGVLSATYPAGTLLGSTEFDLPPGPPIIAAVSVLVLFAAMTQIARRRS